MADAARVCHRCGQEINGLFCTTCNKPLAVLNRINQKIKDVREDSNAEDVGPSSASQIQRPLEKLRITVHSISQLPLWARSRTSQLSWSVKLLSVDGKPSQVAESSYVAHETEFCEWQETFEFSLEFEGQILELKLREQDRLLGYVNTKSSRGVLHFQVYPQNLKQNKIVRSNFRLRSAEDSTRPVDGVVSLSISCVGPEEEEQFWRMFERQEVDLQQRAVVDGFDEDQNQVAVLLQHVKPILEAIWVLFYTIMRPIFWTVVDVRTLLTDWDDPGATVLGIACGLWMWWTENVLFGLSCIIFAKLVRLAGSQPQAGMTKMEPKAMLNSYQEARKALYYGRVDPLSYKVLSTESKLRRAGESLLVLENALLRGEKRTCTRIFGGLIGLAFSVKFLPVFAILTVCLRTVFVVLLLHISILVPIRRRLPLLFPGLSRNLRKGFNWLMESTLLRLRTWYFVHFAGIKDDPLAEKINVRVKEEDWIKMCKEIGRKIVLNKGEKLGDHGTRHDMLYRLTTGAVRVKSETSVDVIAVAPTTLMAANVFIGHGRQASEFVARKFSIVYAVHVEEFRIYLVSHPHFARDFWESSAAKLGTELKLLASTSAWGEMTSETEDVFSGRHAQLLKEGKVMESELEKATLWKHLCKTLHVKAELHEMEMFSGVSVKAPGGIADRFVDGLLVMLGAHVVFMTEDRKMSVLDWDFPLSKVESTKVTPPQKIPFVSPRYRLKITVGPGEVPSTAPTGGVAAMMRGLEQARETREAEQSVGYYVFATDGTVIKRIMRVLMARLAALNISGLDSSTQFFGPVLNGVELTMGMEKISKDVLDLVPLTINNFPTESPRKRLPTVDVSVDMDALADMNSIWSQRSRVITDQDRALFNKESFRVDRVYSADSVILRQGLNYNSMFFIKSGVVAFKVGDVIVGGVEVTDNNWPLVGSVALVLGEPLRFTMVAMTRVAVRMVTRKFIDQCSQSIPSFAARLYEWVSYELTEKISRVWVAHVASYSPLDELKREYGGMLRKDPQLVMQMMACVAFTGCTIRPDFVDKSAKKSSVISLPDDEESDDDSGDELRKSAANKK